MPAVEHYIGDLLEKFPTDLIDEEICDCDEDYDGDEEFAAELTEYVKTIPEEQRPKRGDTISLNKDHSRNEGIFFWTGDKIIFPGRNDSEYGHVPDYFLACEEFPPDHWENVIHYNCRYIHVHPHYLMKMKIYPGSVETFESNWIRFIFTIDKYLGVCYFDGKFPDKMSSDINDLPEFKKIIENRKYMTCYGWEKLEMHNIPLSSYIKADFNLVIHV